MLASLRCVPLQVLKRHAHGYATAAASHSPTSTVNEAEISHFSRLASQWWDERGEFAFLHRMNPVRMRYILDKIREVELDECEAVISEQRQPRARRTLLEGMSVLDVGCGGGLLSESLARAGAHTLGIDASQANIGIASVHAQADPWLRSQQSLEYRQVSAEGLLAESSTRQYDVVCSMEVIEHVDNPAAFLDSCTQLVKPGGHLFLSTISRTPLAYFLTIFAAEHVLQRVTPGTHTYAKYINPEELIEYFQEYSPWISSSGPLRRKEAEVREMIYNPLSGQWDLGGRGSSALCNYIFWVRRPVTVTEIAEKGRVL